MRQRPGANPFLAGEPDAGPLVVGHRGVPRLHQENSLVGFRRAVALGVPAVELDVQLTRDGVPIVFHDAEMKRLTGHRGVVAEMSWDQVSRRRLQGVLPMGIDAHGQAVIARYDREQPIALLAEVLAEIGQHVAVNIELKIEAGAWWGTEVGPIVAEAIADAGAIDQVIVTSFDLRKLRATARAEPGVALGFAFDDGMFNLAGPIFDRLPALGAPLGPDPRPNTNARRALSRLIEANVVGRLFGTHAVGAEHTLIGPNTVARLHESGVAIGTHTLLPLGSTTGKPIPESASDPAEVYRLVDLGVDWIETDDPEALLEILATR